MAREKTVKGRLGALLRFRAAMNNNREELQHLEVTRARMDAAIDQHQETADRQAVHTAGKQEASQLLRTQLTEAERMATVLKVSIKQHFGIRAEKLVEFGLQPFRGRKTSPAPQQPEPQTLQAPAPAAGETKPPVTPQNGDTTP